MCQDSGIRKLDPADSVPNQEYGLAQVTIMCDPEISYLLNEDLDDF